MGYEILVTTVDKDIAIQLLNEFGYDYKVIGKVGKSLLSKILCVPILDWKFYCAVRKFSPDLILGIGSIRATHVAKIIGAKSIIFNDTEATLKEHILYYPFADYILSPYAFGRDFGKKHVRYDGFHELAYLHPNRFEPNLDVLEELGVRMDEKLFVIRFIAWEATHDAGHCGFSKEGKIKLIKYLAAQGRVIITQEGGLPEELKQFQMPIPLTKMHDVLSQATLHISEGATMASEAAILGTPTIYLSTINYGTIEEQSKHYGLIKICHNEKQLFNVVDDLLHEENLKEQWQSRRENLLKDKIDVSHYIVDFIDNLERRINAKQYENSISLR